jgi:hypothetical protein
MEAGFDMLLQQDPWGRPLSFVILRDPTRQTADERIMWWQIARLLADRALVLDGETREVSRRIVLPASARVAS